MTVKSADGWARWEACDDGREALSRLAETLPQFFAASTFVSARCTALRWYATHRLIELDFVREHGVERAFVLHGPEDTHWLNGESEPIHDANEAESLTLTDDTVADYLRFFLHFLRADRSAFVLVESADEVEAGPPENVADDAGEPLTLEAVRGLAAPLAPQGFDAGNWLFDGVVSFQGGIFRASFSVEPDGIVTMIDDDPIGTLGSVAVPEAVVLELVEESGTAVEPAGGGSSPLGKEPPADREVTEAVVAVLLEDAVRALDAGSGHNMLLRHFNSKTQAGEPATPIGQLERLVADSRPVVIIESDVPFVEDFVAGLITRDGANAHRVERAGAMAGDDLRCEVTVHSGVSTYLVSFHTYRGLFDAERIAHELSLSDATVLIGCNRVDDVPEPLRTITDLFLTFPQIDRPRFTRIFERVFGRKPADAAAGAESDWTRYLVPADFHTPRRLALNPDDALQFLRERVQHRLMQVSPDLGPRLDELHGLGEARQVAEDLIADIRAAQLGQIHWSAVDRGLLLVGAPGTGKTTLARAIAKECGIKFVIASAATWQSAGYLDAHLRAMRADFAEARRFAPAILFLDEIDSVGSRDRLEGSNAQYQTEVINALLEEIQGVGTADSIIVIGATNFVEKVDPALRRAGRLDQVVNIPLPNIDGLEQIFTYHLSQFRADGGRVAADVETRALAELAFGLTGADIEFFVRGGARRARRENRPLAQADLVAEVTRRPRRPDSAPSLGPLEMRRVAVHEAGHTVAQLVSSTRGANLSFASIIPRMDGSLGFVASVPSDTEAMTRRTLLERLEAMLGGRAAEEVVYGADDIGAGAGGPSGSDLAVATRLATFIVCQSGLGDGGNLQWTETPSAAQDQQIEGLLRKSYSAIVARLQSNRSLLDRVADALVAKQELSGADLRHLAESVDGDRTPTF